MISLPLGEWNNICFLFLIFAFYIFSSFLDIFNIHVIFPKKISFSHLKNKKRSRPNLHIEIIVSFGNEVKMILPSLCGEWWWWMKSAYLLRKILSHF